MLTNATTATLLRAHIEEATTLRVRVQQRRVPWASILALLAIGGVSWLTY